MYVSQVSALTFQRSQRNQTTESWTNKTNKHTHTHNDYHMPLGLRPLRHKQLTSNIHVTSVGQSSFVLLSTY